MQRSFLWGSCFSFKGRDVGTLSAGGGMGFSSLGRFCFARSIMAGLVVDPMKWGGCKAKNLCGSETAGHGSTPEHCLGGATTASRGLQPDSEGFGFSPTTSWGPPQPLCPAQGGGGSFCPTPQPCPGDNMPSGLSRRFSAHAILPVHVAGVSAGPWGRKGVSSAWEKGAR